MLMSKDVWEKISQFFVTSAGWQHTYVRVRVVGCELPFRSHITQTRASPRRQQERRACIYHTTVWACNTNNHNFIFWFNLNLFYGMCDLLQLVMSGRAWFAKTLHLARFNQTKHLHKPCFFACSIILGRGGCFELQNSLEGCSEILQCRLKDQYRPSPKIHENLPAYFRAEKCSGSLPSHAYCQCHGSPKYNQSFWWNTTSFGNKLEPSNSW